MQREYRTPLDKRLDVCLILDSIKQAKWTGAADVVALFKRRYLLILGHWTKILPKPRFLEYFNIVLASLAETGVQLTANNQFTNLDMVLINEHCRLLHEMLKEVYQWLNRADQIKRGS